MMPERLTRPNVGLMPTIPHADDGQTMDPSVSVPIAPAHMFADTAPPEPELDPQGFLSSTNGFFAWPPRPLQPLDECVDLMFAHSLRLALPSSTAPAERSFAAMKASWSGMEPSSASEPAVVVMRSAVSMLSLSRIGI